MALPQPGDEASGTATARVFLEVKNSEGESQTIDVADERTPAHWAEIRERRERVRSAVLSLPPEFRETVVLCELERDELRRSRPSTGMPDRDGAFSIAPGARAAVGETGNVARCAKTRKRNALKVLGEVKMNAKNLPCGTGSGSRRRRSGCCGGS